MNIRSSWQTIRSHKKKLIITGGILLLLTGYSSFGQSDPTAQNSDPLPIKVAKGTIRSVIKAVGTAELANEQNLRFNQNGKIEAVYVKKGDPVEKDQLIAVLDHTTVVNNIRQNQINLENAQISLQELLNGSTETQLITAQNTLEDNKQKINLAETNLEIARQNEVNTIVQLDKEIALAKLEVANKQNAADSAKKDIDEADIIPADVDSGSSVVYASTLTDAIIQAKAALVQVDNMLNTANTVLGLDPGTKDNTEIFGGGLGFFKPNILTSARDSFRKARQKQAEAWARIEEFSGQTSVNTTEMIAYLEQIQDVITTAVKAEDYTFETLANTVVGGDLTNEQLNSFKSSVQSSRSSGQSQLATINNVITDIKNNASDVRNQEDSYNNALYALEQAKQNLQTLEDAYPEKKSSASVDRITQENELQNLKNDLKAQESNLKETERGPTSEEIARAKNNIASAQLALEKSQQEMENYELRAPFDGLVSTIDFQVGDNLIADDTKYVYLQNPDLVQITVELDQIDIVKIQVAQNAEITFDALPEEKFTGSVLEVDPAPISETGVTSYKVTIALNKGDATILSGMTATVNIITAGKKNVLLVPNTSLMSRQGKSFVQKIVSGDLQPTEVTPGISDGLNTEIISGLSEGDEIATSSTITAAPTSSSSQNQQSEVRQFFRASGGGGFGGDGRNRNAP